jgi:hypothetical protein
MQERAVSNGDDELTLKVDETIQLWTKMWMADSERYNKMRNLLESMDKSSEGCVIELTDCLERLTVSMTSQTDHFLATSTALVTQSRTAVKEERHVVLRHLEAVHRDVEELNVSRLRLLAQIANLQDDRRSLLLRMEQMVPRSEVSAAQQEAEARAGDLRSLERESARQRDVIESLTARLSTIENEKLELLGTLQVWPIDSSSTWSSLLYCHFLTFLSSQNSVPRSDLSDTRCATAFTQPLTHPNDDLTTQG